MAKKIIIYIIVCICATSLNCNKSGSSGPPLTPGGCVWYNAPDPFFFNLDKMDKYYQPWLSITSVLLILIIMLKNM